MKKFLAVSVGTLVLLMIVLIVRTIFYPFPLSPSIDGDNSVSIKMIDLNERSLLRFRGGLRIPTVSSADYGKTNFRPFVELRDYLEREYPLFHSRTERTIVNGYSLVFRWKGRNSNLKPILFLAHSDVVPPGELSGWDSLPFSGDLNTGKIYGRGALDMKNVLFGLLEASESLMNENFIPERDVYYSFGHDEEVGGREGALKIARYFHELGLEFDGVYDEGGIVAKGGSITGINRDIALVGVAEKGFLSAKILVKGTGGHSSMPPLQSSIGKAAEIMLELERNQLPSRIIPTFGEFLDIIGSEMSFEKKIIFANRWLFDPILLYQMSRVPATNALTRTTTALTMMKGSDQSNVLSPEAELVVNFRILPGESVDDVRSHIKKAVDGFDVEITDISNTRGPSIVSRTDTIAFVHLRNTISKTFPDALISPYITIGGTDAFKYEIVSNNIYRFNPVVLDSVEQRSIHNQNEYISLENFRRTVHFYKLMIAGYPAE